MINTFGRSAWISIPFISIILIVGLWRLYAKAGLTGAQSLVPILNFVGLMKIVGRPTWHSLLLIIPSLAMIGTLAVDGANLANIASNGLAAMEGSAASLIVFSVSAFAFVVFLVRVQIDLCNSYGRNTVIDYVLITGLSLVYIMYMGLDYEIDYKGPSYNVKAELEDTKAYA